MVCCSIWLIAVLWSSFPLFGWGEYIPEPYGLSCTVAWKGYHTSAKDAFYVICSFLCFTLIPVLLIVVSQCQILYKVSRFSSSLSARGIRNNLRHAEKRLSVVSSVVWRGTPRGRLRGRQRERQPFLCLCPLEVCFSFLLFYIFSSFVIFMDGDLSQLIMIHWDSGSTV